MNGMHDLGGMHGMGPIMPLSRTSRCFTRTGSAGCSVCSSRPSPADTTTLTSFRHGIERMAPAHYLESSYYEHWLHAIERLLVEKGTLSPEEINARMAALAKKEAA